MKERVAIVVQRYGKDVNGGAEVHARALAQQLASDYEIDVLTSCAHDYHSWQAHYAPGVSYDERGIRVIRFEHPPRVRGWRSRPPLLAKLRYWLWRRWPHRTSQGVAIVPAPSPKDTQSALRIFRRQGPFLAALPDYLDEHAGQYAAVIFFTALYYPTAVGMAHAAKQAIMVPTLHDEKMMYLPQFHQIFRIPRRIMFNTRAEMMLAHRLYGAEITASEVCGVGVDVQQPTSEQMADARFAYGLQQPYFIYVGRVDTAKGCDVLFDYFRKARAQLGGKLVVVGQMAMDLPQDDCFVFTGYIDDTTKIALMAGATALVVPSRFESLSLVVLESLLLGVPVAVNGDCEVLKNHATDSGAGVTFSNEVEFVQALKTLGAGLSPAQIEQGRNYVREHYSWERVMRRFRTVIAELQSGVASV